jgi:3'(2'), 5'-bisphosphate nucleotidase
VTGAGYEDAHGLRKDGDRLSHEFIVAELAKLRPTDAVLSEEGTDDAMRLSAKRVWIVDPLDGTREYGEAGRGDWAVHIALWDSGELSAGAVALPARGLVLSTVDPIRNEGLAKNGGVPLFPVASAAAGSAQPPPEPMRIVVSRSRPPAFVHRLVEHLGAVLAPMGSAGAKAAAVILGEADAYVHAGGQYEWDSAAPVAVALAAGFHASRIDGSRLAYNQPDPSVPDLVISSARLAPVLLAAIRDAQQMAPIHPSVSE